ncbi:MAG: hypothetical protein ABSH20_11095 [Tepidisphaeraceae bacterium]|jgi:hypothetical protein
MRKLIIAVLLMASAAGAFRAAAADRNPHPAASQEGISDFFSPHRGCTDAVVAEIGKARKAIRPIQSVNCRE